MTKRAYRRTPGSPPQVRGKPAELDFGGDNAEDHPRRCGENPYVAGIVTCEAGSPPQVRGKHFDSIAETADGRITPAGAGKTFFPESLIPTSRDHPRRCGENTKKIL